MKNLRVLIFALLAILSFSAYAQKRTKEIRDVESFSKVEADGAFTIYVAQGPASKVEIETTESQHDRITTKVSKDRLVLSSERNFWNNNKEKVIVYLTVKDLEEINISGAVNISSQNLKGSRLKVELSGATKTDLSLNYDFVGIDCSGASKTTLRGTAKELKFEGSGASKLEASTLKAQNVTVDISGAGKAEVYASETLDCDLSGAAKVEYAGNPKKITQDVSGAAKIVPLASK